MSTVTSNETIKTALDKADPNKLGDLLAKVKLGTILDVIEETITISSGTTLVLSTDSAAKKAALMVQSVEVITGTATGVRTVGPSTATPSTSVVQLGTDGDTLEFEAAITVARVRWLAAPDTALSTDFPTTGIG